MPAGISPGLLKGQIYKFAVEDQYVIVSYPGFFEDHHNHMSFDPVIFATYFEIIP